MSIEQSSPVANPAATRSGFGRSGSRVVKVGAGIWVFVLVGFLWEGIIAWLKVPEYIAPPPSAIRLGPPDQDRVMRAPRGPRSAWISAAGALSAKRTSRLVSGVGFKSVPGPSGSALSRVRESRRSRRK